MDFYNQRVWEDSHRAYQRVGKNTCEEDGNILGFLDEMSLKKSLKDLSLL